MSALNSNILNIKVVGLNFPGNVMLPVNGGIKNIYSDINNVYVDILIDEGVFLMHVPTSYVLQEYNVLAISSVDYELYGCPKCGTNISRKEMSIGGTHILTCGNEDCRCSFEVLVDLLVSGAGTKGHSSSSYSYPLLIKHPRQGIPKTPYKAKDIRPDVPNSDYFYSRGVGYDLAGFIKSTEAGIRILDLVKSVLGKEEVESWLDYRDYEPSRIQFKFQKSEFDLEKLNRLVSGNSDILTREILELCKL